MNRRDEEVRDLAVLGPREVRRLLAEAHEIAEEMARENIVAQPAVDALYELWLRWSEA